MLKTYNFIGYFWNKKHLNFENVKKIRGFMNMWNLLKLTLRLRKLQNKSKSCKSNIQEYLKEVN